MMRCDVKNRKEEYIVFFCAPTKSLSTSNRSATKLEDAACALRYDAGSTKNVRLVPGPVMRKSACLFLSPSRLQSAVSSKYACS